MKTLLIPLTGLWLLAGAPGARAQIPPPAEVPITARPTNLLTLGTNSSFFTRNTNFGRLQRTNTTLPAVPFGTATPPTTVPGATPNFTPPTGINVAGQTAPVRPTGGVGGVPGALSSTASSSNINIASIVPKGSTNLLIPASMMRFQEADLSQVLELYSELTGKTILKSPQVPQNVKLTLRNQTPLSRQQGIDALHTLLGLNGIAMVPEGEVFVKAVPATALPQEATPFTTNEWSTLPDAQVPVAQIVQLKNLSPEEATAMMQPFAKLNPAIVGLKGSPFLVIRDYAENVKRMLEILEKVDVAVPLEIDTVVIPIKYALAGEIASVLSGLGASTSSGFGSSGASSGLGGGSGFGGAGGTLGGGGGRGGTTGLGGMGGVGGGLQGGYGNTGASGSGFGAGGNRQLGGVGGGGGALGASRTGFGNQLNRAVNRAVGAAGGGAGAGEIQLINQAKIVPDERSNALLIFADRRDLATISNIIAKLDVVLPQVLIEALILEVNLGDGQSVGVSMLQKNKKVGSVDLAGGSLNGTPIADPRSIGSLTNVLSSGFSYFGRVNQDFDFAIQAVANDSRINVLSRPRIVTSTAKPASIFIGETRPYITGTYNNGFGGGGNSSQYSQLQIGINLDVLPIINQEGLVVMDIQQHISQAGKDVQIDGNPVPSTINRDANAYVAVRDRDTIMLGGFISTVKKKSTSGVPYLKDIPGLGVLFRSNSEDVQRIELVLLIRPTVLPTPEASALTTAAEMDKLPNVKRAEREVDEYNAKQQKKELMERERLERLNQQ